MTTPLQLEVKIDADAVQKQVVQAILGSVIGAQIEKAIQTALSENVGGSYQHVTLVQHAVRGTLQRVIHDECTRIIETKKDQIRAQLAEKLTDEVITGLTANTWQAVEKYINNPNR